MRQYESIWLAIKAAETESPVLIRVHHTAERRLIQAVKLEKTKEVAVKKQLGLPRQGRLGISSKVCEKSPDFRIISFHLRWDSSKL